MAERGSRKFTVAMSCLWSTTGVYVLTLATAAFLLRTAPEHLAETVQHITIMWAAAMGLIMAAFGASNAVAHFAGKGG